MFFNKKDNAVKAGKNTNPTTERMKKMMFKRKKTTEVEVTSPKIDEKILRIKMVEGHEGEIEIPEDAFQINFGKDPATMSTKDLLELQSSFFAVWQRSDAFYRIRMIWSDGTRVSDWVDEDVVEKDVIFGPDFRRPELNWSKLYRGTDFPYNVEGRGSWMRSDFATGAVKSWSICLLKFRQNNEARTWNNAGECIVHKKDNGYYAEFNLFDIMITDFRYRANAVPNPVNRSNIQYHIDIVDNKFEFYWMMDGARVDGMNTLMDLMKLDNPFTAYCAKRVFHCFMEWVSSIVSIETIIPVAQYIPKHVYLDGDKSFDFVDRTNYFMNFAYPNQITKFEMDWIGQEMSTKKILNRAYENAHGVTKKFFGDINEIKDMDRLMFSIIMVLAFKRYNPTCFEGLKYDMFWMEGVRDATYMTNKHTPLDLRIQKYIDSVNRFTDIFGKREDLMQVMIDRRYIAEEICDLFDEFEDNAHRAAMVRAIIQQNMNFEEMREYFSSEKSKLKTEKVVIDTGLKKMFNRFHEKKIHKNVTVIVPQDSHDYITWGAMQNNCIGSYSREANSPTMLIIGFKANNGKWLGHAMIEAYVSSTELILSQLLGKSSSVLPIEERNIIVSFLEQNMVNCSSYAGMRELDLV